MHSTSCFTISLTYFGFLFTHWSKLQSPRSILAPLSSYCNSACLGTLRTESMATDYILQHTLSSIISLSRSIPGHTGSPSLLLRFPPNIPYFLTTLYISSEFIPTSSFIALRMFVLDMKWLVNTRVLHNLAL